jgi:DNA polymerase-3 subunit epsilon
MRLQLERPLTIFDLETTGVDPQTDRIIEFAAVRIFPEGVTEERRYLLDPGVHIPEEASAVHGYHDQDVVGCPRFAEVAAAIVEFLGTDIGGYNVIRYDLPLLNAELQRVQMAYIKPRVIVDSLKIFAHKEPHTLTAAVRKYCQRDHEGAHGALADSLATLDVLEGQLAAYDDLPVTVEGLGAICVDPDSVDMAGKLRWEGQEIVMTFGKHKGIPLSKVDPGYFKWAKANGVFGPDVRELIDDVIWKKFPTRTLGD